MKAKHGPNMFAALMTILDYKSLFLTYSYETAVNRIILK